MMNSNAEVAPAHNTEPGSTPARASIWLWIVFVAMLLWYTSGALPFGGPQCDAIREAAGIEHLARYGWEPLLTHNFVGCPGLAITLWTARNLTGADPLLLLGVLSAISGIVFITASAGLIHRLCGVATPVAGLIMLLSPVAVVAGMYPNDLVTAAALTSLALYLFAGRDQLANHIAGAICLGLAGWFRADAVLVTGVIPFLVYRGSKSRGLRALLAIGTLAAGIALAAVYASGSSVSKIIEHARDVTDTESPKVQYLGFYASFLPMLVIFGSAWGMKGLVRSRHWRLVAIFIVGALPLWIIHAKYPLPKYFTYIIPWFALLMCCALNEIRESPPRRRKILTLIAAVCFVGQYIIGLQITLRDKPWREPPQRVLCTLYERQFDQGRLESFALVVGPGTFNTFGHAGTPMTGILFSPLTMQREQRVSREYLDACTDYVAGLTEKELRFFSKTYDGKSSAMVALVNNGYRCTSVEDFGPQPRSQRFIWLRGDQRAILYRVYTRKCNMDFLREIGELTGSYFVGSGAEEHAILEQVADAKEIIRTQAMRVRAVYEVTFPPLESTNEKPQ